jgi:hypothetical protein
MKRLLYLIIFIGCGVTAHAQYQFQATSLSEALILLDQSSKRYDISFVYDELEDFTVTKTIKKGCSLPEAVREVCGFYPVRVTTKGRDILVECIQKDRTKLSGRLVDADRQPVAYANIVLYDDTLVIGGGVSNEAGDFVIPCGMSQAKVRISCVGFKTIERQMPVADVGTIRMQMDNQFLKNVTISGSMPIVRNESNRLQYIVANDAYAQGLTAYELLHRVPMVSMANGRATILGKGTAHYMMNGRVLDMDDELFQQRLWSMRAEDIERIEVISMPTGKYLTDLGGGYINIVMNRDQSLGWRSDLSMQAGVSDKWSGKTDASVNYASEKFDMAFDVNGNWLTKTEDKEMYHTFSDIYNSCDKNVISHKNKEDKDLGINLMLRYLPRHNLEIGAFASYLLFWPKSDIVGKTITHESVDYSQPTLSSLITKYENDEYGSSESELIYAGNHILNLSTYFDWTLRKPDNKLCFSYNYYQKQDNNTSNVYAKYYGISNTNDFIERKGPLFTETNYTNDSFYRIHSARVDLSMPLSITTIFNAGLSYTNIKNEANTDMSRNSKYFVNSSHNLTDFSHEENIFSGYVSFQHHFSKKINAIAALHFEHTKTKNTWEKTYVDEITDKTNDDNIFPALSLNYRSDHGEQIGAAWSMSITRPNFYDLNPLMVFESGNDISQGNYFLTPSYENRVEVNFSSHWGLYTNIYYTHGKDQIDWITLIHGGISLTIPSNAYKSDKTGLYVNYHHGISKWVNIITEGELFYYDAKSVPFNSLNIDIDDLYNFFSPSYNLYYSPERLQGWGKRFTISGDIFLNLQHSLILNVRYDQWLEDYVGMSKVDAYGYFTFALRYSLLNDRLKLSLTAADPFHQQVKDITTHYYSHFGQNIHTNLHSHYIGLTATCSLGGKKVRQIHHDFDDAEQQRAEKKQ